MTELRDRRAQMSALLDQERDRLRQLRLADLGRGRVASSIVALEDQIAAIDALLTGKAI